MIQRIEEIVLSAKEGESQEDYDDRVREIEATLSRVLDNVEGHAVINILLDACNPMLSRYRGESDPIAAAYRDGQADVISFLLLHGTSKRILK